MEESDDHTIEESEEFNLVLDVSSSDAEGDESKKRVGVTSQPTEMPPSSMQKVKDLMKA